ncbi:hypothetical protein HYPSUDRAFT_209464 [Hypholoma sublateritium FD-334 SS-4]|uniref:Uncharacterized protein n=1 Tax=Hypholoma sublateritium (strain FD-334 SS-4) TaxID=945553 RepID=A0A0D2NA82_HYPSF|nr:hypothetical protein HYPSUDRAFT_209464 [Hypholoma sublateritium FD-334 SS-4]
MLQNTIEAYQRKIAENGDAPLDLLYRLQHEYNHDVLHLQTSADAQVASEIARAEATLASPNATVDAWAPPTVPPMGRASRARGLSGRLVRGLRDVRVQLLPVDGGDVAQCVLVTRSIQGPRVVKRGRRDRVDRAKAQQDEFARRVEAIIQRKRAKRAGPARPDTPEPISASSSTSSTTSTTSSTSEPAAWSDVVFKAENQLSVQDILNLPRPAVDVYAPVAAALMYQLWAVAT